MLGQPGVIVEGIEIIDPSVRADAHRLRYLRMGIKIAGAGGDNCARRPAKTNTQVVLQVVARRDGLPVADDHDIIIVARPQEQGGPARSDSRDQPVPA
jgi:hypothetical protein